MLIFFYCPEKAKSADMDDLILFTNVNPYANIWKMYTSNTDLVKLFKMGKSLRPEVLSSLPNCFEVRLSSVIDIIGDQECNKHGYF